MLAYCSTKADKLLLCHVFLWRITNWHIVEGKLVLKMSLPTDSTFVKTSLPPNARVWIFPLERQLKEEETKSIQAKLSEFLSTWKSHGTPVQGVSQILYNRFVVVSATVEEDNPSGCATDGLHRFVTDVTGQIGIQIASLDAVFYRDRSGSISQLERGDFMHRCQAGEVVQETIVFNNAITTLQELTSGAWELECGKSWHRHFLPQ